MKLNRFFFANALSSRKSQGKLWFFFAHAQGGVSEQRPATDLLALQRDRNQFL